MKRSKPLLLVILDGWGYREETRDNAIAAASTPIWDELWKTCPHALLKASGSAVGVPAGQMGNSEVGHLHIGAGRSLPQDLVRLNQAIESGEFFQNTVLISAVTQAIKNNKALHIIGLLSPGGVHSHERHIASMLALAAQHHVERVYVHGLLDGRDTPPQSALTSIQKIKSQCHAFNCGELVSLCGRYYAMDRDQRWERTQQAYDMMTQGIAPYRVNDAKQALLAAYQRGENDEFVRPTIVGEKAIIIQDGDIVIFMNFRADRMRQLTKALTEKKFNNFQRKKFPQLGNCVTLTEYAKDIQASIAFPPVKINNGFGEYVAKQGFKQLRIAETEKYAHVTYFFNGGREMPFDQEDRILIPSPNVATYDLMPAMSAPLLTEQLCDCITRNDYDVIICNYANPDMVGHTGNFAATVKAIEIIDQCFEEIIKALDEVGGELLITADHGNAEKMYDPCTQQAYTAHTTCLVPFLYRGRTAKVCTEKGALYDVAPTMLYLLGLPCPQEMTGKTVLCINS